MAAVLAVGLGLYACGGGSSNSAENNDSAQSEQSTPNAAGQAAATESESSIDVNASSDSKGVGPFTAVDVPESIDADMAAKGEEVFQTKCTVCHQATDQKLIGPGLKGISKIRTPEWIMNMVSNPDEMLDKDPVAKALLAEFNGTRMTNQGVTKEEARQLLEFLRQNDAQ